MEQTKNKYWQWAVTILLPLCCLLIPTSELVTQNLKTFLVVTLIAIFLIIFDLVDAFVAAIVLFMGYSLTGVADLPTIFSSWQNDVAWMVIGSLVFSAAINETGVMKRMAYAMILKLGGSYSKMLWAIYLVAVALGVLTSVSTFPLVAAIAFAICKGMGYSFGSKEANGVTFAAMAGAICPFAWCYNPINAGTGAAVINMYDPSLSITWLSYLQMSAPWIIFDLIWMVLITKVFFKPKDAQVNKEFLQKELAKMGVMTKQEKKAVVLTVIIVVYMILSSFTGWPTAYGFSIIAWAAFLPGINLANSKTLTKVNFGTVFFTVACVSIGTVGSAVGIGELITQVVSPMFQGLSDVTYIGGMWGVSTVANFLLTPVAVTTALGVPLMQIGVDLGISPLVTLFTILQNTANVFMPHENSAYLLFFAFGLFTMKDFVKYNAVRMVLHFVFMMLVIVPYWYLIGML